MKELVFGTTNPAKVAQVQSALASLDILVRGFEEIGAPLNVAEDGNTAQENARKKATAYAEALGQPVLSMDNALYFEGIPEDKQPGIHVRRIASKYERPSDEELLHYYATLIDHHGGEIPGRWEFAIAVAYPDGQVAETILVAPRRFVSKVSANIIPGYPLESLQIDTYSGKYISDMTKEEQAEFWEKTIGAQLCQFVKGLDI